MLTKYDLVNVPEGGVRHSVGNWGLLAINEQLTDDQADACIKAGLGHYFKAKDLTTKKTNSPAVAPPMTSEPAPGKA